MRNVTTDANKIFSTVHVNALRNESRMQKQFWKMDLLAQAY